MNSNRRLFVYLFWIVLGIVLAGCSLAGLLEEFWQGMGFAFIFTGGLQLLRYIRYRTNPEYRENFDIEVKDERNKFIANRAWAWAGYFFVLIAAISVIVFKLMGREDLMMLASGSVGLIVLLYWGSYMVLKRKF